MLKASAAFLAFVCLLALSYSSAQDLPVLNWIQRSDWYNIRTSGGAAGNGIADDTQALQNAIDLARINDTVHSVVYIPPGTYRITRRLKMIGKTGCSIVGHGGSSVLRWDGGTDDWMFESDGNPLATFMGITWDGADKAAWGFVHSAKALFENQIRHEFSVFRGFQSGALRAGGSYQAYASSEQQVRNCLFIDNPNYCVSVQDPNYYNHQFANNDFVNCGIGISMVYFAQGSMWRNHFENSIDTDIEGGEPSYTHSIRHSSSVGSHMFVRHPSNSMKYSIQSVAIEGWSSAVGAIVSRDTAPRPIIDVRLINPPTAAPPIVFNPYADTRVDKLIGGIEYSGPASTPIGNYGSNPYWEIPRTILPETPTRGDASWRVSRPYLVGSSLIDCYVSYVLPGRNSGNPNDTVAIQACINAAKQQGNNVVAYFPRGSYYITSTIQVTGGNYIIEGSGYHTTFAWFNDVCGTLFQVSSPQNITIRNFKFGSLPDTGCVAIRHTRAVGGPSSSYATYDRIWGQSGTWFLTPQPKDMMILDGLDSGDRVHIITLTIMLRIRNCGRAKILTEFFDSLPLIIEGEQGVRDGFIGIESINGMNLQIRDNQDVTIADYYFEQSGDWGQKPGIRPIFLKGAASSTTPAGTVVISNAKAMAYDVNTLVGIDNYKGSFTWMFPTLDNSDDPAKTEWIIEQTGSNPLNISLIGPSGALPVRLAASGGSVTMTRFPDTTASTQSPVGTQRFADAIEKISQLIKLDAEFNPVQRFTRTVVDPPSISPAGGTFAVPINVQLYSPTAASIRYTLDGSDPTGSNGITVTSGTTIQIASTAMLRAVGQHPSRQTSGIAWAQFTISITSNGAQRMFPSSLNTTEIRSYNKLMFIGTQFMPIVSGYVTKARVYTTPQEAGKRYVRIWDTDIPDRAFDRPYLARLAMGPFEWIVPNTTGWVSFDFAPLRVQAGRSCIIDVSTTANGKAGIRDYDPGYDIFHTSGHLIRPPRSSIVQGDPWMTPWATEGSKPIHLRDVEFIPDVSALQGPATAAPATPPAPSQVFCDSTRNPIVVGSADIGSIVYVVASRDNQGFPLLLGTAPVLSDGKYSLVTDRLENDRYTVWAIAANNFGLSGASVNSTRIQVTSTVPSPSCNATLVRPPYSPPPIATPVSSNAPRSSGVIPLTPQGPAPTAKPGVPVPGGNNVNDASRLIKSLPVGVLLTLALFLPVLSLI